MPEASEASTRGLPSAPLVGRWLGSAILLTAVTNYSTAQAHRVGLYDAATEGFDPAFRLGREILIWSLGLVMANGLVLHRRTLSRQVKIPIGVFLALAAVASSTAASLISGTEPALLVAGLRALPLLLILAGLAHYSLEDRAVVCKSALRASVIFVVLQSVIAAQQLVGGVPALYGTTYFGPRVYGSMATPNLLGISALGLLALVVLIRPRRAILLALVCVAVTAMSGSRTAVLGVLVVLLGMAARKVAYRWLLVPLAAAMVYMGYLASSTTVVSGRVIESEGRLTVWREALTENIDSPLDWLIGAGVGVGTNAANALAKGAQAETAISDSTVVAIILSFGLIGLLIVTAAAIRLVRISDDRRWVALPPIALVAVTLNLPEVAPFNVMAVLALATLLPRCLCGTPSASESASAGRSRARQRA